LALSQPKLALPRLSKERSSIMGFSEWPLVALPR
jgi:hypothetical protein